MINIPIILVFVVSQFYSITAKKNKLFKDTLEITKSRSETFSLCLKSLKDEYKNFNASYGKGSAPGFKKETTGVTRVPTLSRAATYVMEQTVDEFYPYEYTHSITTADDGILNEIGFKEAIENIKK